MRRADGELVFRIGPGRLLVREARGGERAKINDFRVLVDHYDRAEAVRRMRTLGAELRFEAASNASYFVDPDGIVVYLID
jgi:hypothetical protein